MRSLLALSFFVFLLNSCSNSISGVASGPANMGRHPNPEMRKEQIAKEARGDFYYGRRYYVQKTRFWGYLREPGNPAYTAKLVIFNEARKRNPDRLPEAGPGQNYGFDNNYEYKIYGRYTGRTLYEPNSNQVLPEFLLTDYKVVSTNPGWLFTPSDHYNPIRVTLLPRR